MNINEITTLLTDSATNTGKYIPWWEYDPDNCDYQDHLFPPEEIQQIIECIRTCDAKTLSTPDGTTGYSLFHLLVWHNFYESVKTALSLGVDANLTDGQGREVTPLLLTCCRCNYAMAKLLTDHGADRSHCDAKGRNGFHYLAHPFAENLKIPEEAEHSLNQRQDIANLLADSTAPSTADINKKDANGIPPLIYLVDGGLRMISCVLIDTYLNLGADPYFVDDAGGTPLMRALLRCRKTAALCLMEYPELVSRKTASGKTPLMIAEEHYQEGLCVALKDHGAEGECKLAEVDTINLIRLADNAFTNALGCQADIDELALGIYLTKKLLKLAKKEDDYGCVEDLLQIPLHYGYTAILDLLFEAGVDFTEPNYYGMDSVNCLRDKCLEACNDIAIVQKLFDLGIDMDSAVIAGRTPACILAQAKYCPSGVFSLFSAQALEQRDNSGRAAIHYAVMDKDADTIAAMIAQGININLPQDAPSLAGATPLHLCCIHGNLDAAKLLIKEGADDTICNTAGMTAAHYLLLPNVYHRELKSEERVALFTVLKHIDFAGNDGRTPLMLLLSYEMTRRFLDMDSLLQVLLEKGADVNQTDHEGNTPLLLCAQNFARVDLVRALCEAGADLNAVDADGNNALYHVLKSGSQGCAKYLLKKGADYNHANNEGVTPAQIAAEKGFDTLFSLMKDL